MKAFFTELFQYNTYFNQLIISALISDPERASEKSLRLLSHMLDAHQIWNSKIITDIQPCKSWEIHPIGEALEMDKKNTEQSLLILDQFALDQLIRYSTSKGHIFNHSIRDILFHVINHSTYHRAQIATKFRLAGMEPLLTDYIYYKMKPLPS